MKSLGQQQWVKKSSKIKYRYLFLSKMVGRDLNLGSLVSRVAFLPSHLHITFDGKRDIFLLK